MEITSLDKQAYDLLMSLIKQLTEEINVLKVKYKSNNLQEFLNGDEVCRVLHISRRTLQNYRDKKLIDYIQLDRKILYPVDKIQELIEKNYIIGKNI